MNFQQKKNAEIFSGLGLDVSPTSSFEDNPTDGELAREHQNLPEESPASILEVKDLADKLEEYTNFCIRYAYKELEVSELKKFLREPIHKVPNMHFGHAISGFTYMEIL